MLIGCLTEQCAIDAEVAIDVVSRGLGVSRAAVGKAVKKARIARKRRDQSLS
jgi:hypothetical protein